MAGKEEKLDAFRLAQDLATKIAHAATSSPDVPESISYMGITTTIGVMTDIEIGCNTKYRNRKLYFYARGAYKLARLRSATWVMKELGWLVEDDYEILQKDIENLSKMLWGLVRSLNRIKSEEKNGDLDRQALEADKVDETNQAPLEAEIKKAKKK
jgi:hypothetical protein